MARHHCYLDPCPCVHSGEKKKKGKKKSLLLVDDAIPWKVYIWLIQYMPKTAGGDIFEVVSGSMIENI